MPSKSFLAVAYGSTVTFDADQSRNFQVTLEGSPALKVAGGQEGDEISILLIQGGSGSYLPTWPSNVSFEAGQAPSLPTAVGSSAMVTLKKKGSTWKDVGGAPSRLPSRIASASLGTIIGAGVVALTLVSSNGAGGRPQAGSPDIQSYCTGSSCTVGVKVGKMTASGVLALGQSGALAVGTPTLDARGTDAKFFVKSDGTTVVKNTVSGTTLKANIPAAGSLKMACWKADNSIGYCTTSGHTLGDCGCN